MRSESSRILIVGGGEGASAILEMLQEEEMVHVAGVFDPVAYAPGLKKARALEVPAFTDLGEALRACEPCTVFNLTDDIDISSRLKDAGHADDIIGGTEALMMWQVMIGHILKMKEELSHRINYDPLTGIYNRDCILDHMKQGIAVSARYGTPYSAVLIGLDHFRSVNDTFTYPVGDTVFKGVVNAIQERLRQADIPGRRHGDELLVLLPQIDGAGALLAARKWLAHVSARPIDTGTGKSQSITFSAGVAAFDKAWVENVWDDPLERFLLCLEERLHRAKERGRNRVVGDDAP
ncbi:MAG: GGDEF domain-containing protein [Mariprofundaceae bacterium]|nr:GGDEF domain-containing protein [Mariprofundaceae bacterium]